MYMLLRVMHVLLCRPCDHTPHTTHHTPHTAHLFTHLQEPVKWEFLHIFTEIKSALVEPETKASVPHRMLTSAHSVQGDALEEGLDATLGL